MAKGIVLLLVIMFAAMWVILRPGFLFAPPSPDLPEGMTLIYLDKPAGVRVFTSTAALCTAAYGSVSYSCLDQMLSDYSMLFNTRLVELPYMEWLVKLLGLNS